MDNNFKSYDYASLDDFNKGLVDGRDIKSNDYVGKILNTIEGFECETENQSIIKNQQEESEESVPHIQPIQSIQPSPIEIKNNDRFVINNRELLRDFWEKYKLWLVIALTIVVLILFLLIYIIFTGQRKIKDLEMKTGKNLLDPMMRHVYPIHKSESKFT